MDADDGMYEVPGSRLREMTDQIRDLSSERARDLLAAVRECVTVVRVGEKLVIRLDPATYAQMGANDRLLYQEALKQMSLETGVAIMLVVADEIGVCNETPSGG